MSEKELDALFEVMQEEDQVDTSDANEELVICPTCGQQKAETDAEHFSLCKQVYDLKEEKRRLEAINKAQEKQIVLTLRIAEKGGISVYGVGKFPVTLYYPQWVKVFALADKIEQFYAAHKEEIDRRSEATKAEKTKKPIPK